MNKEQLKTIMMISMAIIILIFAFLLFVPIYNNHLGEIYATNTQIEIANYQTQTGNIFYITESGNVSEINIKEICNK